MGFGGLSSWAPKHQGRRNIRGAAAFLIIQRFERFRKLWFHCICKFCTSKYNSMNLDFGCL